jgi:hypothetical protein
MPIYAHKCENCGKIFKNRMKDSKLCMATKCRLVYAQEWKKKNEKRYRAYQKAMQAKLKGQNKSVRKENKEKATKKYPLKNCKTSFCQKVFRGRLDYCPSCAERIKNFYAYI